MSPDRETLELTYKGERLIIEVWVGLDLKLNIESIVGMGLPTAEMITAINEGSDLNTAISKAFWAKRAN